MTEEHKTAEVIPWETFRQRRLNRHALDNPGKPLNLPKPVEVIEPDWDDVPVMDRGLLWGIKDDQPGPLTLFFIRQSDPGDEI